MGGGFEKYATLEEVLKYVVNLETSQFLFIIFTVQGGRHAPAPWRVNTVLSNHKEFAEDFNCKEGQKLNPANRCIVW